VLTTFFTVWLSMHYLIRDVGEWQHRSFHTDRREETVDLHMFLQMIGPAV